MAIGKSSENTNIRVFPKYIGIGKCKVLSVNPTIEELKKIYGESYDKEPTYINVITKEDGSKVETCRIDFILHIEEDKNNGINTIQKITFKLQKEPRISNKNGVTKMQVIDEFGRTAWVTKAQYNSKEIPTSSTGNPLSITKNYVPCYIGQEELISFLRIYLNIASPTTYDKEKQIFIMKEDANDYISTLDNIEDYFGGNFKELKEIITLQPNNIVQVLFGLRSYNNNLYQDSYSKKVLRNGASDNEIEKLKQHVESSQSAGSYRDTTFEICLLKEYSVLPTETKEIKEYFSNNSSSNEKDDITW